MNGVTKYTVRGNRIACQTIRKSLHVCSFKYNNKSMLYSLNSVKNRRYLEESRAQHVKKKTQRKTNRLKLDSNSKQRTIIRRFVRIKIIMTHLGEHVLISTVFMNVSSNVLVSIFPCRFHHCDPFLFSELVFIYCKSKAEARFALQCTFQNV